MPPVDVRLTILESAIAELKQENGELKELCKSVHVNIDSLKNANVRVEHLIHNIHLCLRAVWMVVSPVIVALVLKYYHLVK